MTLCQLRRGLVNDFNDDPRNWTPGVVEQFFGTNPAQVCVECNMPRRAQEYDGRPAKCPHTRISASEPSDGFRVECARE